MDRPAFATRRNFLLLTTATTGVVAYGLWSVVSPSVAEGTSRISVETAHQQATAGEIILLDIRRPDEWQRTGIGEGALPLDMRRDDFIQALDQITSGDRSLPVAVICARGVRSARLTRTLNDAGYTNLIDVPEGMLGSTSGAGWLAKGLPVTDPS